MNTQVKAKSSLAGLEFSGGIAPGFWLLYLLLSVVMVGGVVNFLILAPLRLLGRVWSPAHAVADSVMLASMRVLMRMQPWLAADFRVDLPDGGAGCLLVSNHRSHLDAFLLLSRVRGVRILAKGSLFRIPFLAAGMRVSRQIPVTRGDLRSFLGAMDRIRDRVLEGETVHVFAEMTRCEPGFRGVQEFSVGPFRAAMQGGFPVVPIVIRGTDEAWPKGSFGIRFRRPVRLVSLPPLNPGKFGSAEELMHETRRVIERELRR